MNAIPLFTNARNFIWVTMSPSGSLVIAIACLFALANAQCPEPDPPFECDPANPNNVNIYGTTLTCPEEKVCNARNKEPCAMCIDYKKDCDGKFTCPSDPTKVQIGQSTLNCNENFVCNKDFEDPCKPCIPKVCAAGVLDNLQCSEDLSVAVVDNVQYPCASGFTCNAKKLEPCTYCIPKEDSGTETTTSSSVAPTSSSSTSPDPNLPNCNNGSGVYCYPRDSKTYYKCVCEWSWFVLEVADCTKLKKDSTCKKVIGLC